MTDKAREEFERNCIENGFRYFDLKKDIIDHDYENGWIAARWRGWQAGIKYQSARIAELEARVKAAENLIDFELMTQYESDVAEALNQQENTNKALAKAKEKL